MTFVSLMVVTIIGVGFVGSALFSAYQARRYTGSKKWLTMIGYALLALGAFGFFGMALVAVGVHRLLPPTLEFPIGHARNTLTMPDGKRIVIHEATDRIQIYDANWRFLRGWFVDAGGGSSVMGIKDTNKIEVLTVRGNMRFVYDLGGTLVSKEEYDRDEFGRFPRSGEHADVPTRWWLWMFTSPFYSWLVMALGAAFLFVAHKRNRKARPAKQEAAEPTG